MLDGHCVQGCTSTAMLERLTEMDDTLDRIQKSLDEYLETKRQPSRFYFISNDDLLEILGQATRRRCSRTCASASRRSRSLDMKEGAGGAQGSRRSASSRPSRNAMQMVEDDAASAS